MEAVKRFPSKIDYGIGATFYLAIILNLLLIFGYSFQFVVTESLVIFIDLMAHSNFRGKYELLSI
jgi:hypothetical protein